MSEDNKQISLGKWGVVSVSGLAGAILVAGLAQFTECKSEEPSPVDPVVDAGEPEPSEPDADVIDAAIPEEDAEVPTETDAGEPASF